MLQTKDHHILYTEILLQTSYLAVIGNFERKKMSQELSVHGFVWIKNICNGFVKSYNKDSDAGYFFEVDVKCFEQLHKQHNYLPFLPKGMKIEKCKKLV